jgi:hypothetical protein
MCRKVLEIRLDCDEDVVLLKIEQAGGIACHTGRHSCFFQKFEGDAQDGDWQNTEPVLKDRIRHLREKEQTMSTLLDRLSDSHRVAQAGQRRRP